MLIVLCIEGLNNLLLSAGLVGHFIFSMRYLLGLALIGWIVAGIVRYYFAGQSGLVIGLGKLIVHGIKKARKATYLWMRKHTKRSKAMCVRNANAMVILILILI